MGKPELLGWYKPGKTCVISDSSGAAGMLGRTVVQHELVHEHLTLASTHGQWTALMRLFLDHFFYEIDPEMITTVVPEMNRGVDRLLRVSRVTQEGYATWFQTAVIHDRFGEAEFLAAVEELSVEYRGCLEVFTQIGEPFGVTPLFCLQELLRGVALAALDTPIFDALTAERWPREAALEQFLGDPAHCPDQRLQAMFEWIATTPRKEHLRRFRELSRQMQTRLTDENERDLKLEFSPQLIPIAYDVAAAAGLSMSRNPMTLEKLQALFDRWCDELAHGVRLALTSGGTGEHRFTFETIERRDTVRGCDPSTILRLAERARESAAPGEEHFFTGFIGPLGRLEAWTFEFTWFTSTPGGGLTQKATFTVEPVSAEQAVQTFVACGAVLVVQLWVLDDVPVDYRELLLRAATTKYFWADTTSTSILEEIASLLGPLLHLRFYPPSIVKAGLVLATYGNADREHQVLALLDPMLEPAYKSYFERSGVPVSSSDVSPLEESIELFMAHWEVTYGTLGYAATIRKY